VARILLLDQLRSIETTFQEESKEMNILIFLLIGLIAGWLASFVMGGGYGLVGDLVVGVLGAFIGGWLFSTFAGRDITGFDLPSILIAFVGAVILLAILHLITRGRVAVGR
jgi:uncharacterized membrane protein YeaQ/YmgE (transglycosylase-associated protein family)